MQAQDSPLTLSFVTANCAAMPSFAKISLKPSFVFRLIRFMFVCQIYKKWSGEAQYFFLSMMSMVSSWATCDRHRCDS